MKPSFWILGLSDTSRKGILPFIDRLFRTEGLEEISLTADGHLRGCLFSDQEQDMKTPLREHRGGEFLLDHIRETILHKPKDHGISEMKPGKCVRLMNSIGG